MDLQELQEKLAGKASLEAEREDLFSQKSALEERLRREKIHLEYEQSDVQELEDNKLKSLFYSVIGKKEERLRKEEDEAEDAKRQYEDTQKELEAVNARIKRIEFELREVKRAERDYELFANSLSRQIAEIRPRLSETDAIELERLQKQLDEQAQKQLLYAQITEGGKELQTRLHWEEEAWREAEEARQMEKSRQLLRGIHGGYGGAEYAERKREAQERRRMVTIQAQRIQTIINEGLFGGQDAPTVRNGMLSQDKLERWSINVAGNIGAILAEIEERTQNSKRYRAKLEGRLHELLLKYQTI